VFLSISCFRGHARAILALVLCVDGNVLSTGLYIFDVLLIQSAVLIKFAKIYRLVHSVVRIAGAPVRNVVAFAGT
jgi:hypothetical protein